MSQELSPVRGAKVMLSLGLILVGYGCIALLERSCVSSHLKQRTVNADLHEQAKKAVVESQERERIAREEQEARDGKARKEQQEQARLVSVPGTRYIGTISGNDAIFGSVIQRFRLVFTEQNNFMIGAVAGNPNNPKQYQIYTGELVLNPQPERDGTVYPIVLSPVGGGKNGWPDSGWQFYRNVSALKLRLTDEGLEGREVAGFTYTIRLQREGRASGTWPSNPVSKAESDLNKRIVRPRPVAPRIVRPRPVVPRPVPPP